MSDAGDMSESFVKVENKIDIEETLVNLNNVKIEPNEVPDFEEHSDAKQYRITLGYENIFGESSHTKKFEEDYDNLIGFMDKDVIMENAMIEVKDVKEEHESFNGFDCSKCSGHYKGYCLKCSSLSRILNNASPNSGSSTIPTDILEIRDTSMGKGVFLLRTLPVNILFGPFEGILGIESTMGHCFKINNKKLVNIKNGNWMKNIVSAASASLKNLDIFQIDGNLYFRTNREITEGEELLIYFDDGELRLLDNSEEYLYTPQKLENLPKIFACTLCCLGFVSNKCLMEHKKKCPRMEYSSNSKDFELIECHYCKIWMEKWEYEEYHVAYCLEKHHRMYGDSPKVVERSQLNIKKMEDQLGIVHDETEYQYSIDSEPLDHKDNLQLHIKDKQADESFSGIKHEILFLTEHTINEHTQKAIEKKYKCSECSYQTNYKYYLIHQHSYKHKGIKPMQCHICMVKFSRKHTLNFHIKNKHTENGSGKDYKCSECSYQTNYKNNMKMHSNIHKDVTPFNCNICKMKFNRNNSLKLHIKDKHIRDGNVKDYKCPECSYETNHKSSLKKHLFLHADTKQFQCDVCERKFTQEYGLKSHKRNIHAEKGVPKNYKCLECSFQTNYRTDFKKHSTVHTGIKEFQCEICSTKFSQKRGLKRHMKSKHSGNEIPKKYKCPECYFQTNYNFYLQEHLNIHLGIKPFRCHI